jgi:hypothetical protein
MACDGEMILTAVKPDEFGMVVGFTHETFQCSLCEDVECRFVFRRELRPVSVSPKQSFVSASSVETTSASGPQSPPTKSASSLPPISSSTQEQSACNWERAVKTLRNRQADIRVRTRSDEKNDTNARFNQRWEKLAVGRKPRAAAAATSRSVPLARKSARALRAELLGSPSARNCAEQIEPPSEEIQRFKQFWDSLLTGPAIALTAVR